MLSSTSPHCKLCVCPVIDYIRLLLLQSQSPPISLKNEVWTALPAPSSLERWAVEANPGAAPGMWADTDVTVAILPEPGTTSSVISADSGLQPK